MDTTTGFPRSSPFRCVAALLLAAATSASASAQGTTFFVEPTTDASGDLAFEAAVANQFAEIGDFGGATCLDAFQAGPVFVDLSLTGIGSSDFPRPSITSFSIPPPFELPVPQLRSTCFGTRSRIAFDFSPPVRGFGCWIAAIDSFGVGDPREFFLIVTDGNGGQASSPVLPSLGSGLLVVEGFLGATSSDLIVRAEIVQLIGGSESAGPGNGSQAFLVDAIHVAPDLPLAIATFDDSCAWMQAIPTHTVADFDAFTGPLSNQFPGAIFGPFDDGTPRVFPAVNFDPPLISNPNVMISAPNFGLSGGGWAVDFSPPVKGLGFWTADFPNPGLTLAGSNVHLLDGLGGTLGIFHLPTVAGWSAPGAQQVFAGFVSAQDDIARVEIDITEADTVFHDNFMYGVASPLPSCTPAPAGTVGWWPADGDASDLAGSNDGTLLNGAAAGLPGFADGAFDFDGVDDVVDIANEATFDFERTDSFTIECWIKSFSRGVGNGNQFILSKSGQADNYRGYAVALRDAVNDEVCLVLSSSAPANDPLRTTVCGTTDVIDGTWHHVAGVNDGTFGGSAAGVQLYVDGLQEAKTVFRDTLGTASILNDFNVRIGGRHPAPDPFDVEFLGRIDELAIYDRALSSGEIQTIFAAGRGAKCKVVEEPPTAVAGPDQSIHAGETVLLDGTASFDDNTASENLEFGWTFTSVPAGSSAGLTGADTAAPSFVVDLPGTYGVQLIVTDEAALSSLPDEVEISSSNLAPTADTGMGQGGVVGFFVLLDGTGSSDPEFDPLTFSWSLSSTPPGSLAGLSDSSTATPSFVPDLAGTYVVQLVVNDGFEDSVPDEVEITVISGEEFAESQTVDALDVVAGLPKSRVTTRGNQRALTNFLSQVIEAIQANDLETARDKLNKAIGRTDGCILRGMPDGNGPGRDWITDCTDQQLVYDILNQALTAISP